MNSEIIRNYLLFINVAGFILFIINFLLYTYTKKGQIDLILTVTSLLGGSLGIVVAILIFDRDAEKGNMMSRVFVICMLIIQIVLFLFFKTKPKFNFDFVFNLKNLFIKCVPFLIYVLFINIVTFLAFAIDKYNAIQHRSRIRIVTLLSLSFIGGSIGGLAAMYLFRHKIRKDYFVVGLPMIIITQILLLFYLLVSFS